MRDGRRDGKQAAVSSSAWSYVVEDAVVSRLLFRLASDGMVFWLQLVYPSSRSARALYILRKPLPSKAAPLTTLCI